MLLKEMRPLFSNKRCYPDGWFEAFLPDRLEHTLHVAAEGCSRLEPVSHRRLVAIIDLNVLEPWYLLRDEIEIVEHLPCCNPRAEAVPRAPPCWRRFEAKRFVIDREPLRELA